MPVSRAIRLMLVDDHPVMRAGLAALLSRQPDFQVVAEADDGEAAIALWPRHRPDVVLLDIAMRGLDGIETVRRLRAAAPEARVLMFTSSDAPEDMARSLQAGAAGYLTKRVRYETLVAALHDVHAGGRPLDPLVRVLPAGAGAAAHLTARELEVLGLLREGLTNTEIGRRCGTSPSTAKFHIAAILEKLAVIDRTQAVARAYDLGIFKPSPRRS